MTQPINYNGTRSAFDSTSAFHAHSKRPMPLPRTASPMPPTPKPRTLFPLQDNALGPHSHYEPFSSHLQAGPSHARTESSEHLFGSNQTLDSDYSGNYHGMRRPSIETISTYLSLESVSEDNASQNTEAHYNSNPKMDTLIHLDDSMSDDEVFSEDQEVQNYLMNGDDNYQMEHSNGSMDYAGTSLNSRSHFIPISPNDEDAGYNSISKRKRISGEASTSSSFYATGVQTRRMAQAKPLDKRRNEGPSHQFDTRITNNNLKNFKLRKPKSNDDELLVKYCKPVTNPPSETCSICMCDLMEDSSYESSSDYLVCPVISLNHCDHTFHEECLQQLLASVPTASRNGFLQCPICKTIHGEKRGCQPPGRMKVDRRRESLPGYSDCGTIQITYIIHPGIQGPEHPSPGQPYYPIGFPRVAYLPENPKGEKVLRLLRKAFDRRLIFTVGTSVTTGMKDAVTWNEIHHKTSWHNRSGHGYPDPNYLDNVIDELKSHGVFDE